MKSYTGELVFITGGAHGIGLSLARIYHAKGARVVVVDINEDNLQKLREELPDVEAHLCDITNREMVYSTAHKILKKWGAPYLVLNNAGVVENSSFLDCSDELLERTMNVNIISHFWVLKAFLPSMLERGRGHVCQIASAAGLMGVPGMAAYCGSKHAVIGFSKSLKQEVDRLSHGKIKFTIVCPSFINTGMFDGVKPARLTPLLDQEEIASIIFEAVDKNRTMVLEPFMVKILPALVALLPTRIFEWVARVFQVDQAMEEINTRELNHLSSPEN